MFKRIILITAALLVLKTYGADEIRTDNVSGVPTGERQIKNPKAADQEITKKIAELSGMKTDLIRKIHEKRKELLKSNPKLRRMHVQLLKQTRELALELDSNREMRKLNDSLIEVERQLEQEKKKKILNK